MKKHITVILTFLFIAFLFIVNNVKFYTYIKATEASPSFLQTKSLNKENTKIDSQAKTNSNSNFKSPNSFWRKWDSSLLGTKDDYEFKRAVGIGGWSKVYKATHTPTGDQVAIKYPTYAREKSRLKKEFKILDDMKNAPNFLKLIDLYEDKVGGKTTVIPVYEIFDKESYKKVLKHLDKAKLKYFMYETLRTLEYAHERGIIHRDIKPPNVLMNTKTKQVRVIDWGISEYYRPDRQLSTQVGTIPFKAPEVYLNMRAYDTKIDIWSAGCMFAEMAFQKPDFFKTERPKIKSLNYKDFRKKRTRELLDDIAQVLGKDDLLKYTRKYKGSINDKNIMKYIGNYKKKSLGEFVNRKNRRLVDALLVDLLESMLVIDHTIRITASEALQHPYFDEVRH